MYCWDSGGCCHQCPGKVPSDNAFIFDAIKRTAKKSGKEAEGVAVVVEGAGTRSIQGTWIDGSAFEHAVAKL